MDSQEEKRLMMECMMAGGRLGEKLAELDDNGRALLLACIPVDLDRVRVALGDVFKATLLMKAAIDAAADAWGEDAPLTRDLGPALQALEETTFVIAPAGREALASLVVSDAPNPGPDVTSPTDRGQTQRVVSGAASSVPAGEKCVCGDVELPGRHAPDACRNP